MRKYILYWCLSACTTIIFGQNESKLVIDASPNQTNVNPLIRLRNSQGNDLMWIHSDRPANTFMGFLSGVANTGLANTFIGSVAGNANQAGIDNTAVGYAALYDNRSGHSNTALGSYAFAYSQSGSFNTALGYFSLANTTGAEYNTAIGYKAGSTWNNGYNNVFVGANTDVTTAGLFNVIAIGQGTGVSASSTARFGNSATGSYGGWANWTNVSDGRYKKNVQANVPGLEFILKLEPVTYNLDVSAISHDLNENQGREWNIEMKHAIEEKEKVCQTGFIAQEVERIAREIGFDFSGVDAPKNEKDMYGLRYAEFVVPLVKAVQELSAENERLSWSMQ
ncbi:MAG: tail fiber domain-containing protein, partial [Saprospiraceae bacterium]|nr:tail fiber domain-containing protein [Saprospiraceae bacterium]